MDHWLYGVSHYICPLIISKIKKKCYVKTNTARHFVQLVIKIDKNKLNTKPRMATKSFRRKINVG